jgi:hypothetical protein
VSQRFEADIPSHDVTRENVFQNRRRFLSAVGVGLAAGPSILCASSQGEADLLKPPCFIPRPGWSQVESYWLDDGERFPTPIFNGYGKDVAGLYSDEPRTLQQPLRPGQKAR